MHINIISALVCVLVLKALLKSSLHPRSFMMENTLFFYPSAASEPWELSQSVKPDITLRRQTVLICFMDFMDRRCGMTNQSVRYTNSISPNWHLCWVWRDACCWNCWNAFEMDPMISLWDRRWDPPIVWDLGERERDLARYGPRGSARLWITLSVSPSGLWSLKERLAPVTTSAFISNANPSPTASVTALLTASNE